MEWFFSSDCIPTYALRVLKSFGVSVTSYGLTVTDARVEDVAQNQNCLSFPSRPSMDAYSNLACVGIGGRE
jgi:hypothetical protein